jgi:dihydrofolate reductase
VRTLAVTQNITVDGSVEMLDDWFNPQGQADIDNSDLLEELHRQDSGADAFLVGRRTFEDLRGYWPGRSSPKTPPASPITSTRVQKYVVSSTITDPKSQNSTVLGGDPMGQVAALKEQPGHDIVVPAASPLPRSDRRGTDRRVPPVRLPGRAWPWSQAVPGGSYCQP